MSCLPPQIPGRWPGLQDDDQSGGHDLWRIDSPIYDLIRAEFPLSPNRCSISLRDFCGEPVLLRYASRCDLQRAPCGKLLKILSVSTKCLHSQTSNRRRPLRPGRSRTSGQ